MEYDFKGELEKHKIEQARQEAEKYEAILQTIWPLVLENIPRFLEARRSHGPDSTWERQMVDGDDGIIFHIYTDYDDEYYLSEFGKFATQHLTKYVEFIPQPNRKDVDLLRSLTEALINKSDWRSERQMNAELKRLSKIMR